MGSQHIRDIYAADNAHQHNGNVYSNNNFTYHYNITRERPEESAEKLNEDFVKAAAAGQKRRLDVLAERGADPDYSNEAGLTALHYACLRGFGDIVNMLLGMGVNYNVFSERYGTPLCCAAFQGNQTTVRMLLAHMRAEEIDAPCGLLGSALHIACYRCEISIVNDLISHRAQVNLSRTVCLEFMQTDDASVRKSDVDSYYEYQPLHVAAQRHGGSETVINALLNAGANVQAMGRAWTTGARGPKQETTKVIPLLIAARFSSPDAVRLLLRRGSNPNSRDSVGNTALARAAWHGRADNAAVLLESNANKDIVNNRGFTPAMIAAGYGNEDVLRLLASAGASLKLKDHEGRTARDWARGKGHKRCEEFIKAWVKSHPR